jgi:hypothetical protein
VCIVLAILLTIPAILSHNSQVRLISAVLGLAFVSVGVVIFIWKYFRVGVSAAAGVITIFLNGTLKIIYSTFKAGHAFDFISVTVRTRFLPASLPSCFPIEVVEVDIDRDASGWSKVVGRLTFKIHRRILEDRRVVDALATWIIAKLPSTR